jgi:uncharacterized membrane protein
VIKFRLARHFAILAATILCALLAVIGGLTVQMLLPLLVTPAD